MHFSKELKKIYANFGRKMYHVDLDGRGSLMTGESVAALSLRHFPALAYAYTCCSLPKGVRSWDQGQGSRSPLP